MVGDVSGGCWGGDISGSAEVVMLVAVLRWWRWQQKRSLSSVTMIAGVV